VRGRNDRGRCRRFCAGQAFRLRLCAVEQPGPEAARISVNDGEIPARNFLFKVVESSGFAGKGEADFEVDFALFAEVEPCAGVFALCRMGVVED
jgi:hypothetical protein